MDGILVLGFGILAAVPISIIVLIVWATRHARRLTALESRLKQLENAGQTMAAPFTGAAPAAAQTNDETAPTAAHEPDTSADTSGVGRPAKPPRAFVMRKDKLRQLASWIAVNWIYLVAAASLGLAGIFLLQYGVEKGLLSPTTRVIAALGFGAAMVVGGEYLRRKWGDGAETATAFLPSVFSGAGIITLFAAVLAALHMYALIGPVLALAGLIAIAGLAIILGWYCGPLLAAIGIIGAMVSPFLVGGESDAPELFYLYFALISITGLAIDTIRRWAWISVLTLLLGYAAAGLLFAMSGGAQYLAVFLGAMAIAAIAIPQRSLVPTHKGAGIYDLLRAGLPLGWPEFPWRLAAGATVVSAIGLTELSHSEPGAFWLCIALLFGLFAALAIWARQARALEDLAAVPALGLFAAVAQQSLQNGGVFADFQAFALAEPGSAAPKVTYVLAALAALLSAVAVWRSLAGARWPIGWAAAGAGAGPVMLVVLEIWWQPAPIIGAYPWALSAAAMAVFMGGVASWFARIDGVDKRRVALPVLAALTMISFAFVIVLSQAALTLALALSLLSAALIDRRFGMAPLAFFVQVLVVIIGWRLILDPGIHWALEVPLGHVLLAFVGSIMAMILAHNVMRARLRTGALIMLESAGWSLGAIFVSLMIIRLLDQTESAGTHWSIGLNALVWLVSAANQLWRLQAGGRIMRWVRMGLAAVFGLVGLGMMVAVVTALNPALSADETVLGVAVMNSLALAYLAPALVFALVAWRFDFLPIWLRGGCSITAAGLAALWLALVIRHVWQGAAMAGPGVMSGELYSYTIAMLLTGAGLLYLAISKDSALLRRIAMSVIALTAAKVFLIDASGLSGLTRVFSFLALGLSLAGLAFLNRWAAGQGGKPDPEQNGGPDTKHGTKHGTKQNEAHPPDTGQD